MNLKRNIVGRGRGIILNALLAVKFLVMKIVLVLNDCT